VALGSGAKGTVLRTTDGARWQLIPVPDAGQLDLRDIHAIDARSALVMSAGPGAASRVYRTDDGGASWSLVATNQFAEGFWDAMAFWDASNGILFGDPVKGRFQTYATADGGATWRQLESRGLDALENEGAFAASGSCLSVAGARDAWIVTGGAQSSRVFHSSDRGASWQASALPIPAGAAARGAFSVGFHNARVGMAAGGDYKEPALAAINGARTEDGGASWTPATILPAGYMSVVMPVPGAPASYVAAGLAGAGYSLDGGKHWTVLDRTPMNTVGFADAATGWAIGPKGLLQKYAGPALKRCVSARGQCRQSDTRSTQRGAGRHSRSPLSVSALPAWLPAGKACQPLPQAILAACRFSTGDPILFKLIVLPVALLGALSTASADEGQWQPHQLNQLKSELKRIGMTIPVDKLTDLSKHPMSAIVSTGGCSASFVSPDGLIVTNHHCAYAAIQRNATPEHNYIVNGFLAKDRAAELPGGPSMLVYVTEKVENVSERVLKGLAPTMSGRERYEEVQSRVKGLIAECETDKSVRCSTGLPPRPRVLPDPPADDPRRAPGVCAVGPIGNYGGDVDNYEWPRQTGDFSFLRAYVGKDGRPADPSPDNVPYKSKDFLVVSAEGLKNGDPIILAGYPGRTSRYKLPSEIRFARDADFPLRVAGMQADLAVIAAATMGNPAYDVRYASVVKSINNIQNPGPADGFAGTSPPSGRAGRRVRAWFADQSAGSNHVVELGR
jgi:photosystem II stability/assembly factor-like uncharacterized protein